MDSPLDVATTSEIRRHLAAAQAKLNQLRDLLAPMPDDAATARGGEG